MSVESERRTKRPEFQSKEAAWICFRPSFRAPSVEELLTVSTPVRGSARNLVPTRLERGFGAFLCLARSAACSLLPAPCSTRRSMMFAQQVGPDLAQCMPSERMVEVGVEVAPVVRRNVYPVGPEDVDVVNSENDRTNNPPGISHFRFCLSRCSTLSVALDHVRSTAQHEHDAHDAHDA
jgi:hypothetical protein